MNNLENKTNAELIEIYQNEFVYLTNRANNIILRLFQKTKKCKNFAKVWIEKSITTHDKNEFIGLYDISRRGNFINNRVLFFGVRYVRGMKQYFYIDDHDLSDEKRKKWLIQPNNLTLINQHVIDRYVSRCKIDMCEEDILLQFFNKIDKSVSRVSFLDNSIEVSIEDGIILGDMYKDGTFVYKTFVNKLYENQRLTKYKLDKFNEENRRNKEQQVI